MPNLNECLINSKLYSLSPNQIGVWRLWLNDAHDLRLTANVVTEIGSFLVAGLTQHEREALTASPSTYGPARGVALQLDKYSEFSSFVGNDKVNFVRNFKIMYFLLFIESFIM